MFLNELWLSNSVLVFFNIKKAHFENIKRNLGADIVYPLFSFCVYVKS